MKNLIKDYLLRSSLGIVKTDFYSILMFNAKACCVILYVLAYSFINRSRIRVDYVHHFSVIHMPNVHLTQWAENIPTIKKPDKIPYHFFMMIGVLKIMVGHCSNLRIMVFYKTSR